MYVCMYSGTPLHVDFVLIDVRSSGVVVQWVPLYMYIDVHYILPCIIYIASEEHSKICFSTQYSAVKKLFVTYMLDWAQNEVYPISMYTYVYRMWKKLHTASVKRPVESSERPCHSLL